MSTRGLVCYQSKHNVSFICAPVLDPMAWKQDTFQHPWTDLSAFTLPLFDILRQVLSRVMLSADLFLILIAPLWPQNEWFTDLLAPLIEELYKLELVIISSFDAD